MELGLPITPAQLEEMSAKVTSTLESYISHSCFPDNTIVCPTSLFSYAQVCMSSKVDDIDFEYAEEQEKKLRHDGQAQ